MRTFGKLILRLILATGSLCVALYAAIAQPFNNQQLRMPEHPTGNYDFLQGCWVTEPFKHRQEQSWPGTSTYCFGADGRGTLVFRTQSYTCRVAASASYQGIKLKFVDSDGPCTSGVSWWADHLDCDRRPDGVASCIGSSTNGVTKWRWTVTLQRQGPPLGGTSENVNTPKAKPKSLRSLFEGR